MVDTATAAAGSRLRPNLSRGHLGVGAVQAGKTGREGPLPAAAGTAPAVPHPCSARISSMACSRWSGDRIAIASANACPRVTICWCVVS